MPFGFYIIMAAQFFSALADNALVVVAIAILREMSAPEAYEPLLKTFFAISYVAFAAFVGAFADFRPKGQVMFIGNSIKILGCFLLFFSAHPLLSYALVGLGAAVYSPAKYGILTEYLPHRLLVVANGWIEGLTIAAIIFGFLLGGALIAPTLGGKLFEIGIPFEAIGISDLNSLGVLITCLLYIVAAIFNRYIPNTGVPLKPLQRKPWLLFTEFNHCLALLWRDKLGQISLAVTTLFWGAGATLQFIVIKWADDALGFGLSQSTMLQGIVAFGVAAGAVAAAKRITLRRAVTVIPMGIAMGLVVITLNFVHSFWMSIPLLILVGILSGFFVVPMNALLQHRGHTLMGAGHSISVQNFNENLSILIMTGMYYVMIELDLSIYTIITLFGLFIAILMWFIRRHHEANQRISDAAAYLEDESAH